MSEAAVREIFKRRKLIVEEPPRDAAVEECNVLVINASQAMAKEITMELALRIPGCSIMYAPSVELAKWILKRRKLDLIVSSPLLPDGGIRKLREVLETLASPPDLLVVGELPAGGVLGFGGSIYRCTALERYGARAAGPQDGQGGEHGGENLNRAIAELGADLRNDLNNPLQEIVAMVFVAQAKETKGAGNTQQALQAIGRAAQNMSLVVNRLEDKIRDAVGGQPVKAAPSPARA